MKITLEFTDIEKFFVELPRFAALISMAGKFASFDKVKASGLESLLQEPDLPEVRRAKDGTKIATGSPEQVDELKAAQKAAADALKAMTEESTTPKAADPSEAPEELEKTAQKKKKPAEASGGDVKDTDVRAMLNQLIKAGHRDDVKTLLTSFGAENFSKLAPEHYATVMTWGRELLGGEDNG